MHMADALVSPAVGGTMWAVSAGIIGYCASRVKKNMDDRLVPLMGVMGAFIFTAQMINFAIPATGSSGHLGGGLLLAILLGPYAAFIVLSSVLIVQALFFADGGLLAFGCNIFNLGVFPCLLAYPLIYKPLVRDHSSKNMIFAGALISSVVGLQLGSLGVVMETALSGVSDLPVQTFLLFMQPIHLAIGIVEGLATASVVLFVHTSRPEILRSTAGEKPLGELSMKKVLAGFFIAALLTGGIFSWFASSQPDGLEWSVFKTAGTVELGHESPPGLHGTLEDFQDKTSLLPDYGFRVQQEESPESTWKGIDPATSISGFVGGTLTLLIAIMAGLLLKRIRVRP